VRSGLPPCRISGPAQTPSATLKLVRSAGPSGLAPQPLAGWVGPSTEYKGNSLHHLGLLLPWDWAPPSVDPSTSTALRPWPLGHLHHLGGTTAAGCSAATLSRPSWWLTSVLASATPSLWFSSQQPSGAALAYEAFWNSVFTTDTFKRHYK
jgi:hypothetical protein